MTPGSLPYLNPALIERIDKLELQTRQTVEGMMSGRHRSPFHGQSVEFAEHREYVVGDDLRSLDWKVWAKADRYYVKQYEEETNLRGWLLVDASASMDYGTGETHKFAYASGLAAALAYLLLRQADSVGLSVFDESIRRELPLRNHAGHLRNLLQALQGTGPAKRTDCSAVFRHLARHLPRRGLLFVLSDGLVDADTLGHGLQQLRQRDHDVVLFQILHPDEREFAFRGMSRFVSLEGTQTLRCDPRALRDDYLAALERHRQGIAQWCRRTGVDYRCVRTDEPIDQVLLALIAQRSRMR